MKDVYPADGHVVRRDGENEREAIEAFGGAPAREYALAYKQFQYEYENKPDNEIESIRSGFVKLYAVEQSCEVDDQTDIFDQIEEGFAIFRAICEKPKSHLKAVNEVRPIETVKRIGYESIPYLAAHSEDWLARTAGGLKPARLFSRVEDDEYQIYENRVVKTLTDIILSFLQKTEKSLRDQYEQLHGIMNSSVQTGSFGFDVSFQKAVAELLVADTRGEEYRSKDLILIEKLHKRAKILLRKYRTLRKTRLYRLLRKAKAVTNPLMETNILRMDRQYHVAFKLWKNMHKKLMPQQIDGEQCPDFRDTCSAYLLFCKALCGYTAHMLHFSIEQDGLYYREGDHLALSVEESDGLLRIVLRDRTRQCLDLSDGLQLPIAAETAFEDFYFDGCTLSWENTIDDAAVERFCTLFKTRESRGKEQADEKKRYSTLKQAIDNIRRGCTVIPKAEVLILPAMVGIDMRTENAFRESAAAEAAALAERQNAAAVIVALPKCEENEQRLTAYAKTENSRVLFLPLTMFDINSFRRLQNVFLRQIVSMTGHRCPACGGEMRQHKNRSICDACNRLILTKTVCANTACRHEYVYLSYDVSDDILTKMQSVDPGNFFQSDSLFQYKDIVPMSVENDKIRAVCPACYDSTQRRKRGNSVCTERDSV